MKRFRQKQKKELLRLVLYQVWEKGLTIEEACKDSDLSPEEVYEWIRAYQLTGGLKVGSLHSYRKDLNDGKKSIF